MYRKTRKRIHRKNKSKRVKKGGGVSTLGGILIGVASAIGLGALYKVKKGADKYDKENSDFFV